MMEMMKVIAEATKLIPTQTMLLSEMIKTLEQTAHVTKQGKIAKQIYMHNLAYRLLGR